MYKSHAGECTQSKTHDAGGFMLLRQTGLDSLAAGLRFINCVKDAIPPLQRLPC